jgi:dTDP-4-amino-4,6-dideoxygalactose transaminase
MSNNKKTANRLPLTADSPIPYGKQKVTQADIDAVVEVLKSDYLTQGPKVQEFEEAFAKYVGAKYAVAVANGTAALHLNCLALGVKPGDKVITTPITFAASANCVRYCGGEVVFADIDPETYLLDINEVRKLLKADTKKEIKGIIEDACHSPGGYFVNKDREKVRAGSGRYADLAIFSFHPVKHIAAGEGGMITTNDQDLYEKLLMLRTHGITKDASKYQNPIELALGSANRKKRTANSEWPGWYMEMQTLGYNYRMPDINCALGLSQLQRADEGLKRRQEIATFYHKAFKNIPQIVDRNPGTENSEQLTESGTNNESPRLPLTAHRSPLTAHAYHLYVIEAENRLELYNQLRENNIYAQIHYIPCHLMPYYKEQGWKKGDMPKAEEYYKGCISLPMYPSLSRQDQEFVIKMIKNLI